MIGNGTMNYAEVARAGVNGNIGSAANSVHGASMNGAAPMAYNSSSSSVDENSTHKSPDDSCRRTRHPRDDGQRLKNTDNKSL
jgi:hypothetical protein